MRGFGKYTIWVYSAIALTFLMIPIVYTIVFSFNQVRRSNIVWRGFTLDNWINICEQPEVCEAFGNSILVAVVATLLATALGTAMAIALVRYRFRFRAATTLLLFLPMATPEVVLGAGLAAQFLAAGVAKGLVTIIPNRGAFVCQPSVDEARDVFTVRRAVERCVMERIGATVSKADVARLRAHVAKERAANADDVTTEIIKLSGGFHQLLAEISGSDFLFVMMRDLISRSSLITAVYRNTARFNCGPDEHADIVDAIAKGDLKTALALMDDHLAHVESELDLREVRDMSHDLRAALA